MRKTYWSCTKFADWLRGTKKLSAGTSEEWDKWNRNAKAKNSIRYWLAEEALDKIQNVVYFIPDTIYSIKYAWTNRFVTKTHTLTSNLPRWKWHELDTRILHCMFDELVNYVEIELAAANFRFDTEAREGYKLPFWAIGWFRTRTYRSAKAGREYLDWARNLKIDESWGVKPGDENYGEPTPQSKAAQETLELYMWWTLGRPLRKDPYEESGWSAYCERRRQEGNGFFNLNDDNKEQSTRILEILNELEKQHEEEDEAMLIRLIKVRKHLWT